MGTKSQTLEAFSQALSSSVPAPGGGSAAALTGSLAASLVCMVSALTIGKKAYLTVEAQMRKTLEEATQLRDQLLELIDTDTDAFNHVMACYKLPQGTESEKAERQRRLQPALQRATEVPYQIAMRCYRVLELTEIAARQGNKNAVSDAGAGAILGEAALQAALLNVTINLKWITDAQFKSEFAKKRDELAHQARALHDELVKTVESCLA
jgi:formiminotetrahydrofolate cyclodeaminase